MASNHIKRLRPNSIFSSEQGSKRFLLKFCFQFKPFMVVCLKKIDRRIVCQLNGTIWADEFANSCSHWFCSAIKTFLKDYGDFASGCTRGAFTALCWTNALHYGLNARGVQKMWLPFGIDCFRSSSMQTDNEPRSELAPESSSQRPLGLGDLGTGAESSALVRSTRWMTSSSRAMILFVKLMIICWIWFEKVSKFGIEDRTA